MSKVNMDLIEEVEQNEDVVIDDVCDLGAMFLLACLESCDIGYSLDPDGEISLCSGDIELGEKIIELHGQILDLLPERFFQ